MNTILTIAQLNIRLQLQNPGTYIQSFLVPILLMFFLGAAIPDAGAVLHLDVLDEDNSELSAAFIEQIRNTKGDAVIRICQYGSDDNARSCDLDKDAEVSEDRVKDSQTTAILVIPSGFGEKLESGQEAEVIYRSDDQFNSPTVARTAIETAISEIGGSLVIARVGTQTAEAYFGETENDFDQLQLRAKEGLENPPVRLVTQSTGKFINRGGTSQSVPGMGSMFVLFSLTGLAINLVSEREQGTLQRLFTLPTPKLHIVLGKVLGYFVFGVIQFAVFIIVGTFLDVDWGSNYLAIALLVLAYCFTGTALGFVMATFVRTSDQAAGISTLVSLTLAPLGGAWWPIEIVPEAMQTIGHISPVAWVMDGFGDIIYEGGGVEDILLEVGVLLIMAVALLAFGVWNFRYE